MDNVPSTLRVVNFAPQGEDPAPQGPQVSPPGSTRNSIFSEEPSPISSPSSPAQDRLSQLFPSRTKSTIRPAAVRQNSSGELTKRLSYPSPLVPASEPAYRKQSAPALPSFSEDTSYNSTPDPFDIHHPPPARKETRARGLLNRIVSLRSGNSKYGKLEDDEGPKSGKAAKNARALRGVDEEGEVEPIDCDVSGLEGPIALRNLGKDKTLSAAEELELQRDIAHAGYAAEYERLEAKSSIFGKSKRTVVDSPFNADSAEHKKSLLHGHRRGPSAADTERDNAQKAADKTGEILVVSDVFPIDIGNLEGNTYESRNVFTSVAEDDSKQSYYFPEDPDMPSWRPFSMHWAYILVLIIIALSLAGLQEYVCQLSISREADGGGVLQFKKAADLTITEYFTWKYAPIITLVTYGLLWQVSDFEVKRLEPYYQLSQKTGALASESLNIDYLSFLSWLVPVRALRHRQWAVVLSSLSTLCAGGLVPVLQSASVTVYPNRKDRVENEFKYVRIKPEWSRAVTSFLGVVALFGIILLFQLRRKSGLLSDPKGIAGIAAMATRSHILTDFNGLDYAPQHIIHKQLRHRRYILHKSSLWQGEYLRNNKGDTKEHHHDSRPIMLTLLAGIPFTSYIIIFGVLLPVFIFVPAANVATETIPFLLTAMATVIKLFWATLDCDIRMNEPFYILSRRHAPPRTLTLDYTGTVPGWLPIKALVNQHYIVSVVSFGAICSEILTVCCSSFSVDGSKFFTGQGADDDEMAKSDEHADETFKSFWVSFGLATLIIIYLTITAIIVYLRRSHRFMPRQIGSIASVLGFIHQSKMLTNFVDTERLNNNAMDKFLERRGGTYGLGWFRGRDGQDHCGIDEEELHASYRWGEDWTKGHLMGGQIGSWEHYEDVRA